MVVNRSVTPFIPRKNYFAIPPSTIRGKLLQQGVDPKLALSLTDVFSKLFNKFAVDERLNYDVIEDHLGVDIGSGDAKIVIAASNTVLGRRTADYICTGTGDQTIINTAIASLSPLGGKILFLEGTYSLSGSITTVTDVDTPNIHFCGMGRSTIFSVGSGVVAINVGHPDADEQHGWTFSDFVLSGGSGGIDFDIDGSYIIERVVFENQTTFGIFIEDVGTSEDAGGVIIDSCMFTDVETRSIVIKNSKKIIVQNNLIDGGGSTAQIDFDTADNALICGNYLTDSVGDGIAGGSTTYILVHGNYIFNPAEYGIRINSASVNTYGCVVNDNYIYGAGETAIQVESGSGDALDFTIADNHLHECAKNGIVCDVEDALVTCNHIVDSGTGTANTYSGITLSKDRIYCHGNKINGTAFKWAINISAGTDNLVINNDLKNGYTTAHINDAGTTSQFNLDGSANDWNRQ